MRIDTQIPLPAASGQGLLDHYAQVRTRLRSVIPDGRPPAQVISRVKLEYLWSRDVLIVSSVRQPEEKPIDPALDASLPAPKVMAKPADAPECVINKSLGQWDRIALLLESTRVVPPGRSRMKALIRDLSLIFGVSERKIMSARRTADIVLPRQIGMAVAHRLRYGSLPHIGRAFGRDHTTVLHAVRKCGELVDQVIAAQYPELLAQ